MLLELLAKQNIYLSIISHTNEDRKRWIIASPLVHVMSFQIFHLQNILILSPTLPSERIFT